MGKRTSSEGKAPLDAKGALLKAGDRVRSTNDYNESATFLGVVLFAGERKDLALVPMGATEVEVRRLGPEGERITYCDASLWERVS